MSSQNSGTDMLRGAVVPTFFRYAVPWALAMLLMSSAGVVDGFYLGRHVGPLALAAVNIIMPIFSLLMGFGIMLASGGGVRCGYYRGQKEEQAACAMFTKTMLTLALLSVCITLACWPFLESLARCMGADDNLLPGAVAYLQVIVPFFPVITLHMGLAYFVRVDQRPTLASLSLMGSAVVNIILDYVFIARWGWGISGAAWATAIGYTSMLLLIIALHLVWNKAPHLRFVRQCGAWREVWQAAYNGMSEMINEFSSGLVMLIINLIMMQRIGAYGVAAFTVINYVNWLCIVLAYGISDSLGPLISTNYGAVQMQRVRAFLRVAACSVSCTGLVCFVVMTFFPEEMIFLFMPHKSEATQVALDFMYLGRFMFLFCGINIVLSAYFTGMLMASASATVAVLRSLLLPVILLLLLPPLLGDSGVYVALPLAELLTMVVAVCLYRRQRKSVS